MLLSFLKKLFGSKPAVEAAPYKVEAPTAIPVAGLMLPVESATEAAPAVEPEPAPAKKPRAKKPAAEKKPRAKKAPKAE
jgi:hypothetical protein